MPYGFYTNIQIGPPHDSNFNTLDVVIKDDFSCGNGWICEHRWREMYKMVEFRNIVGGKTSKLKTYLNKDYLPDFM